MKNNRQYESSAFGAFIGMVGILITCLLILITTTIPGCKEFNAKVGEGIKNDTRPANKLLNYTTPRTHQGVDTLTKKDTIWE